MRYLRRPKYLPSDSGSLKCFASVLMSEPMTGDAAAGTGGRLELGGVATTRLGDPTFSLSAVLKASGMGLCRSGLRVFVDLVGVCSLTDSCELLLDDCRGGQTEGDAAYK